MLCRSRLGPIIVGSTGTDLHSDDAFLLVDPGGNDQWHNNAGATGALGSSVSLAIDLAGDDQYRSERGHAQGSGFLGIGVLVDWGDGADRHAETRPPNERHGPLAERLPPNERRRPKQEAATPQTGRAPSREAATQ